MTDNSRLPMPDVAFGDRITLNPGARRTYSLATLDGTPMNLHVRYARPHGVVKAKVVQGHRLDDLGRRLPAAAARRASDITAVIAGPPGRWPCQWSYFRAPPGDGERWTRVGIDDDATWEALVNDHHGRLCPMFPRDQVRRIKAYYDRLVAAQPDAQVDTLRWTSATSDVLEVVSGQYTDDDGHPLLAGIVEPDPRGLYFVGADWLWSEDDPGDGGAER